MQLHNLKRKTALKSKRQVGRGGKRGKTSGRGTKGQNARAGRKKRPEMRDIIKKIPKLRGYFFNTIQDVVKSVKLSTIAMHFDSGAEITLQALADKGIIATYKGKLPRVKILGDKTPSDVAKKLSIKGIPVSASVKLQIEKAGGQVS